MGRMTDAVPTGESMGVPDSATNWMTAMALGEPVGPMIASTFSSVISFLKMVTDWVGSLASSSEMYSTARSPIFPGSSATVFFCGMPTIAVGPVADVTTPTLTWAAAGPAPSAASRIAVVASILSNIVGSPWVNEGYFKRTRRFAWHDICLFLYETGMKSTQKVNFLKNSAS